MPIWFLALLAVGVFGVGYSAFAGGSTPGARSPSGRTWPDGLDSARVDHAVQIALLVEQDPAALRAFATTLESYDPANAARLVQKAGG
jgi:hypothetical protein